MELHSRLSDLEAPQCLNCMNTVCEVSGHSEDRDSHVRDILTALVEASHSSIPKSGGKHFVPDPKKTCPVAEAVPGWKEEVEPL